MIPIAYAEFNIFPLEKLPLYLSSLIVVYLRTTSEAIGSSRVLVTSMVVCPVLASSLSLWLLHFREALEVERAPSPSLRFQLPAAAGPGPCFPALVCVQHTLECSDVMLKQSFLRVYGAALRCFPFKLSVLGE